MNSSGGLKSVKEIVIVALLATILFVQEEVLTFLPNIQLTIFLIVLYSKKLGFQKTTLIIIIHVLLDNLTMGSMNFVYTPFMFVGWELIPLLLSTIFKKVSSADKLAFLGVIFALLYCWIYVIPGVLLMHINVFAYLASDIVFEVLLAMSSYISILWLYEPCSRAFDLLLK